MNGELNSGIFDFDFSTERLAPKEKNIDTLGKRFYYNRTEKNFTNLYKRLYWGLSKFVFGILKSNENVDDIISKTMEAVYFKIGTYNPKKAKFSTWVYNIAFNNCLMLKRDGADGFLTSSIDEDISNMYDSYIEENKSSDADTVDADLCDDFDLVFKNNEFVRYNKNKAESEMYDASIRCMKSLPDSLRIVLEERFINNKKLEDISIDNRINLSSVKTWIGRGLKSLKEEICLKEKDALFEYRTFREVC